MVAKWMNRAACLNVDPELFFPLAPDKPASKPHVAAAKKICARCPVRAECLNWAFANLPHGIAGGMTEDERRRTTVKEVA